MPSPLEVGRVGIVQPFGRTHAHAQYVPNRTTLPTVPTIPSSFEDLLKAAMRACDHHSDGEAARADMRADCLATPTHQRLDLLHHFEQTYGAVA